MQTFRNKMVKRLCKYLLFPDYSSIHKFSKITSQPTKFYCKKKNRMQHLNLSVSIFLNYYNLNLRNNIFPFKREVPCFVISFNEKRDSYWFLYVIFKTVFSAIYQFNKRIKINMHIKTFLKLKCKANKYSPWFTHLFVYFCHKERKFASCCCFTFIEMHMYL